MWPEHALCMSTYKRELRLCAVQLTVGLSLYCDSEVTPGEQCPPCLPILLPGIRQWQESNLLSALGYKPASLCSRLVPVLVGNCACRAATSSHVYGTVAPGLFTCRCVSVMCFCLSDLFAHSVPRPTPVISDTAMFH